MVDGIVSVLVDRLLTSLLSEGHLLFEIDDQFEKLRSELSFMQSYLKDADMVRRKDRRETLKEATRQLRELVYNAEDVIADCQLLSLKQNKVCFSKCMSYCSPQLLKFRHQITERLIVINQGIDEVKKRMETYLGAPPTITSRGEDSCRKPLSYPILMDETEIVGLEDDSTKVRKWILEADGPSTVIGIVGMGGIGKTTLAQNICSSDSVQNSFKYSLFVPVSQNFKLEDLLTKMLGKMTVEIESLKGKDVMELLARLKRELEEQKYLVVLDDVWQTDEGGWWNSLKSALPKRNGCCVIVTTRKQEVAISMGAIDRHIHRPQILSGDDSWSLFCRVAFARNGGKCSNSNLEFHGKEIVARCRGLPLAIKVVGGMMHGKDYSVYEWKRIAEHLKEELAENQKDEPVISSLELSYEELPAYLKPCFLYFAVYPEDYEIQLDEIANRWIGEGFVWRRNRRTAFEIGEGCFAELLNRCLLLGVDKDKFERKFVSCRMHDMVRDMAIKIAREENFISLDDKGMPTFSARSRRVWTNRNSEFESIRSASKLRTLIGIDIGSTKSILNMKQKLCQLKWLRVLDLKFSNSSRDEEGPAKDWLDGIGSLQHLVYLKIKNSALKKLPDSIGNLRSLQILILVGFPYLERLPPTIKNLHKLTTLFIDSKSLRSPLNVLKNMSQLTELRITMTQLEDGELNVLSELKQLRILLIYFMTMTQLEVGELNHQLSPLERLEELWIVGLPGETTPVWLNSTSFPNLQYLVLNGRNLKHMDPWFWGKECGVWKIEALMFCYLPELDEEWARFLEAMPSLRMVKARGCEKLKSFPFDATTYKTGIWRKEDEENRSCGSSANSNQVLLTV